jgi:hypothetical protein
VPLQVEHYLPIVIIVIIKLMFLGRSEIAPKEHPANPGLSLKDINGLQGRCMFILDVIIKLDRK